MSVSKRVSDGVKEAVDRGAAKAKPAMKAAEKKGSKLADKAAGKAKSAMKSARKAGSDMVDRVRKKAK